MALGDEFGPEDYGCYTEESWEFVKAERALLKMEEELKRWCPSSGENVGKLISIPGSDDHKIQCPTCGTTWCGGGRVLPDHNG